MAPRDVRAGGTSIDVTVHSLGSVDAPESKVVLRDRNHRIVGRAGISALTAPLDLKPRTAVAHLKVASGTDLSGARLDPGHVLRPE